MQNLLFLFPDERYLHRILFYHAINFERDFQLHWNIRNMYFWTKYEFSKIGERLDCYRNAGFKIYYAVFDDFRYDTYYEGLSDMIVPKPGDILVPVGIEKAKIKMQNIDFEKLVKDVQPTVIGGFHAIDCVRKAHEAATNLGIPCIIDLDLTDKSLTLYHIFQAESRKWKMARATAAVD